MRPIVVAILRYLLALAAPDAAGGAMPLARRSTRWPRVRDAHLARFPRCVACGSGENVVAHHVVPVQVEPRLELDPENLVTLCQGDTLNCHLWCGHLGHWRSWNEHVRDDAAAFQRRVVGRPFA